MRVVRKVLVLSYEGEDLLVLALISVKVLRRFLFTKILYKGVGLLNVLRVAVRICRCRSNPQPAETGNFEAFGSS